MKQSVVRETDSSFDLGARVVSVRRRRRRSFVDDVLEYVTSVIPVIPQFLGQFGRRDAARVVCDQSQQEDAVDSQERLDELSHGRLLAHGAPPLRRCTAEAEPQQTTTTVTCTAA